MLRLRLGARPMLRNAGRRWEQAPGEADTHAVLADGWRRDRGSVTSFFDMQEALERE